MEGNNRCRPGNHTRRNGNYLTELADDTISQFSQIYADVEEALHFTPEGFPKEEIVKTATGWNADLIIMGTDSRDGLSRLFSDDIAEHVVKNSVIIVMLIFKKPVGQPGTRKDKCFLPVGVPATCVRKKIAGCRHCEVRSNL